MGVTVSHSAMLTHCHTLTQACGYTEGGDTHLSHTPTPLSLTQICIQAYPGQWKTETDFNNDDGKEVKQNKNKNIDGIVLVNVRESSPNPF